MYTLILEYNGIMHTSPGNEINIIVSGLGSAALPTLPINTPRRTPIIVSTNNMLVFNHCKT